MYSNSLMRVIKNSVDCPTLQLSCPKFDIPCNTEDVSVYVKVGSGERIRYEAAEGVSMDSDHQF